MKNKDFFENHQITIIISLLLVYSFQVITAIGTYSITYDELWHINAGYTYLKTGEYPYPEGLNTPLLTLNALPLIIKDFEIPSNMFENHYDAQLTRFLLYARIITLLFGILLGIFIFLWARDLFGIRAGLFALFFYSFEPNIIAHSSLVTSDMLATSCIFIATYFFYKFVQNPSLAACITSGVILGIALTAKLTAVWLIPVYLILASIYFIWKKKHHLCLLLSIFIISLFVLNAAYLFHGTFDTPASYSPATLFSDKIFSSIKNIPLPLPAHYVLAMQYARIFHHPLGVYLFGQYSHDGWLYYFPLAFLIKTQIPLLILILCALVLAVKFRLKDTTFLIIPAIIILAASSYFSRHVNIGLRYVLPIYPFLITFAAAITLVKKKRGLIVVLMIWTLISSIMIAPHYLAYFNELIGGPKEGYKYLVDSNLDWGQASGIAAQFMRTSNVSIITNPECSYTPGRILISANYLQGIFGTRECYAWLREFTPTDNVGYAYLVFDIPEKT